MSPQGKACILRDGARWGPMFKQSTGDAIVEHVLGSIFCKVLTPSSFLWGKKKGTFHLPFLAIDAICSVCAVFRFLDMWCCFGEPLVPHFSASPCIPLYLVISHAYAFLFYHVFTCSCFSTISEVRPFARQTLSHGRMYCVKPTLRKLLRLQIRPLIRGSWPPFAPKLCGTMVMTSQLFFYSGW